MLCSKTCFSVRYVTTYTVVTVEHRSEEVGSALHRADLDDSLGFVTAANL